MAKNNNKIKVTIWYFPEGFGIMKPNSYQEKTFPDFDRLMIWVKKNYANIGAINDYRTFGQPIPHFEVMAALNGVSY